jgi:excisionase family DNA binding protein
MDPYLLSIAETGKALNQSRTSTYKLIHDGRLETIKLGRRHLVTVESIQRLLAARP